MKKGLNLLSSSQIFKPYHQNNLLKCLAHYFKVDNNKVFKIFLPNQVGRKELGVQIQRSNKNKMKIIIQILLMIKNINKKMRLT